MIHPAQVAAVIPTRGDRTPEEIQQVRESLIFKEVFFWDNQVEDEDLGAYGRYEAIRCVEAQVIVTQDDDALVAPDDQERLCAAYEPGVLTALMPPSRNDYTDTVLIGWGSIFDWHLPHQAFRRWFDWDESHQKDEAFRVVGCDFIFPMLTPHRRLDAEHVDLPWAHASNRTWKSYPRYHEVKAEFLAKARIVRDG